MKMKMKMKNKLYYGLLLMTAILLSLNLQAQVTIGSGAIPDEYSLLDLVTTTVKKGLHLPRLTSAEIMTLTDSWDTSDKKNKAEGLVVYNTNSHCYLVWNGNIWLSLCSPEANPPVITTQPRSFNWKETTGTGDLLGIGVDGPTINVIASGTPPLSYQWYEVPLNVNSAPAPATGIGNQTANYTPDLSQFGMRRYYCIITDGNNSSIPSNIARVAVGCGALNDAGNWISFMCYNLGATIPNKSIDSQKAYPSPTGSGVTDATVYGDLYQWGRVADGHEKRTSEVEQGGSGVTLSGGQATGIFAGKFLTGDAGSNENWRPNNGDADRLWLHYKGGYDPCPTGWRIPVQTEVGSIFRSGATPGTLNDATSNVWTWYDGNTSGLELRPDGETVTLFFPAAGIRLYDAGALVNTGVECNIWTSTIYGTGSANLWDGPNHAVPSDVTYRSYGLAVRCVAWNN
jgi:uncharacterized protein (TIGR02145 family)